jgi:hypothetical protein
MSKKGNLNALLSKLSPDLRHRIDDTVMTTADLSSDLYAYLERICESKIKINHFSGLRKFIKQWDEEKEPVKSYRKNLSKSGNEIPELSSKQSFAYILTKQEHEFENSIEVGVRKLVILLIEKMDCITYSSCEGHPAINNEIKFRYRHIGIIPRNDLELIYFSQILQLIADFTNNRMKIPIRVVVTKEFVTSEDTIRPCIDVWFIPTIKDQDIYFEYLDLVYQEFINEIMDNIA